MTLLLRNILILAAANKAYYTAIAHPQCHYVEREVSFERNLTYCPMDYAVDGVCCTELEEEALEETFNAAGDLTTECADYYQQVVCAVCGSYSGHLYELLADDLGTEDGLAMKSEFCINLTVACDGQIDFPDYDGVDYCTMHTGGGDDLWWSYPYEMSIFEGDFTELFPDLPDSDKPELTLAMHQSPDKSMYWMAGQEGILLRVDADSMSSSSTVMDLSGGIFYDSFEEGLLDFAFSPLFDTNGYFYVSWTVNDTYGKNRLSKFQYYAGDPDATRSSEEVLLESTERPRSFHCGGWLGFKPSDYGANNYLKREIAQHFSGNNNGPQADYHDLYWALGDAGPHEDPYDHGQRTDTIFGSIVRISVPSDGTGYTVPKDNYLNSELPEICAIGFRNTWRCGFDRLTDELYCGNVGHLYVESIYIIECGKNYGSVRFEGSRCTEYSEDTYGSCADADRSDYAFPIFEYCHDAFDSTLSSEDDYTGGVDICGDRSVEGSCVIGGHVYRGDAYADLFYGAYVFAEFERSNIHYIIQEDDGTWTSGTIISDSSARVYSFAEDMDGELFIINDNNTIYYLPCGDLCRDYSYLGCYVDDEDRVLSGDYVTGYEDMTTEYCASFCEGSVYFGTEYKNECYCGDSTDDPNSLGSGNCNQACFGDSSQICGGSWAISVYEYNS